MKFIFAVHSESAENPLFSVQFKIEHVPRDCVNMNKRFSVSLINPAIRTQFLIKFYFYSEFDDYNLLLINISVEFLDRAINIHIIKSVNSQGRTLFVLIGASSTNGQPPSFLFNFFLERLFVLYKYIFGRRFRVMFYKF